MKIDAWLISLSLITLLQIRVDAKNPSLPQWEVSYVGNDDTFHQDQYRELQEKTRGLLPWAAQNVLHSSLGRSLGLDATFQFHAPLIIMIKVIPEESLYHGLQGTAGWQHLDGQWMHVLTLNIAAYTQNPEEDIAGLLSHELAHLVLADFLGVNAGEAVPRWLNEGLAQSVTNEGRARVSDFAGELGWRESQIVPCQLDAPEDTFAHGEGNTRCYPEYYLAAERLVQLAGATAMTRLLNQLRDGQKMAAAYQDVTGQDYASFQQNVDAYMADVITGRKEIP